MNRMKTLLAAGLTAAAICAFSGNVSAAGFQEYPIGDEQEAGQQHFKVALVYFQPIQMEPAGMMLEPDRTEYHIWKQISMRQKAIIQFRRRGMDPLSDRSL